jgi:hypothetical protein
VLFDQFEIQALINADKTQVNYTDTLSSTTYSSVSIRCYISSAGYIFESVLSGSVNLANPETCQKSSICPDAMALKYRSKPKKLVFLGTACMGTEIQSGHGQQPSVEIRRK